MAAALLSGAVFAQTAATIAGCPAFPANSIYNTPIDTLPVHPQSTNWINNIAPTTGLRWDTTIPYNVVPGTQPMVPLSIAAVDESDPGPYPIPSNAAIENGSDLHVLVVDKDHCVLYETDGASLNPDGSWSVYSAAKWSLLSNALRPAFWTSADAAGLPMTNLLLRYDEVASGQVNHAIRFTAPRTQRLFLWPARHYASSNTDPTLPPMGARFRLKANFDISGFSPTNQIILKAMKKYGIILADNGLPWFFQLATDSRWDGNDLDNLRWGTVGTNFEAVDESSLMIDPDSGAAIQPNSPAVLSSISVNPNSVTGGNTVSLTVNLTAAATGAGATVMLTGSNAAFPAQSVTVSAGLLTQAFNVTTATVASATPVTITASYNGATATASLTVNPSASVPPLTVTGLTLTPSSLNGGNSTSAKVTLSGPAPSAGVTVALTSSNTAVVASTTVSVAAGSSSASITIPTNLVASSTTVNLTATLNGSTTTATLTVNGGFTPIRINAGGGAYTDTSGTVWAADSGFSGGYAFTTSSAISNTSAQPLYQNERYGDGVLGYTFVAPNGTYTVNLKFAEIYFTKCGLRKYNIAINGSTVESSFDPCAAAGGFNLAVDRSYTVTATNSQIAILMTGVVDNPTVSAIEILSGTSAGAGSPPPPPPPPGGFTPIRINAGGGAYTDPSGNVWAADPSTTGFSFATGAPIGNTTTAPLYQTEHWASGTSVQYSFTVPNAAYSVKLKFAEIYFTSCGHRIFNVAINGVTLDANFDPCAAGGGANMAADRTYNVTVSGGTLAITLIPVVDNPTISAIEITSGSAGSSTPPPSGFTPIRVNAGGGAYTDSSGNAWAADVNSVGYVFSTGAAIANTTAAPLYQTERWNMGPLQYAFSVPNATYTVTLKFAEIYFTTCGHRVFNVNINGAVVDANFDPCAAGGGPNRAADRTYTVNVTSGQVAISLIPVLDNPTISAIQIQ
jgi:hypothetical protein